MANIQRTDPFTSLFGELMKGFAVHPRGLGRDEDTDIRIDVRETDKGYVVRADIPGTKKEDIKVSVDDRLVTIAAEMSKESSEVEEGKVVHTERYQGYVSRSFTVPYDIDTAGVKAKYQDGVLEVALPKKAGSASRQISVQ